ncbi:hypothetical protein Ngar_c19540 [Candidatus Nitrososphaera gargensis Ga9.2]|uniref:Uncharacterized protein n=1 Tax=Nitrososphaera gargensis (strain Ga9.2) TaxID=1237085 RepID=K0IC17_NITGG|nr:hypothetical protein [Candidatus Nitrososphaera gargensis]AFU58886.1 hypothetical protein Ngar_c19540 [Candidatus Nitrososphaera gargensis Ga9.2]
MTGSNIDRREEKSGVNQRNRRQTTTRTGNGMTMEQLIRETRKEVYRAQKKEAIPNKNKEKSTVRNSMQQQQKVIPREMQRYLTSAAVQVNGGALTAHLQEFCSKIPPGSYRVKVLVRKNNKVTVRMTYRGEEQQQPVQQQPDISTPASL